MTIKHFYYLQYPDTLPSNPLVAMSEVYVEVGDEQGPHEFDYTYSLTICTMGYIETQLRKSTFQVFKSVVIVERFEDSLISQVLDSLLPQLEEIGRRIG